MKSTTVVFNPETLQGVSFVSAQEKVNTHGGRTATQRLRQRNESARRRRR